VKSLIEFTRHLYADASDRCGVSTNRDLKTVTARLEHEGLSFLTITLPRLASDLEKALDSGRFASDAWAGFSRRRGLPKFLSGFLRLVFDAHGKLLTEPDIAAVGELRQLLLVFSKIELPCSDERVAAAYRTYVSTEKEVRDYDASASPDRIAAFASLSWSCFGEVFNAVNTRVDSFDLTPRHGPGATAEHLSANSRWKLGYWHERLETVFPMDRYLIPNHRYSPVLESISLLAPGSEAPVRVVTVPKTMKTPRVIAIEPAAMQFAQQALLACITEEIERRPIKDIVSYLSNEPSRRMALIGSRDGSYATLDLSEASDRVSNQLVLAMVRPWRSLSEALQACRSSSADVPGIGVLRLAKYASMGSGTCFPIETMVFTSIVALALSKARSLPPSEAVKWMEGRVRVYGDDIIVPTEYAQDVIDELEAFGLLVNRKKSFWTGKFREACGLDAYDGTDVSVARVRRSFPRSRRDVSELVATSALRNNLFHRGYVKVVAWLDQLMGRLIPYPEVGTESSVLGKHTHDGSYEVQRVCTRLQVPLIKGAVARYRRRSDLLEDYGALSKWFTLKGLDPLSVDHLAVAGRPYASRINVGWTRPD